MSELRLWTAGDAHVGTDVRAGDRHSLIEAITQSEQGPNSFDWDIMLDIGDLSGSQTPPDDDEGMEVVRQYAALTKHRREQVYNVVGNHDASGVDEPTQWWFRKWIDPLGEHPESSGVHGDRRPFPIEGTWERYHFRIGNLLFLCMADRNDVGPPIGRGERGGYPAGAVTMETFEWWRGMVEANPESIIITAHHHMLRETTVASGPWEGVDNRYHGRFEDGAPRGASYLYWVGDTPDAGLFEAYMAEHPGAIDLWIGGHTHAPPEDRTGGRSHIERKWGVTFLNTAALTKYHVSRHTVPMSRLLTFGEGNAELTIQCYLHTDDFAPQGWYAPAKRTVPLSRPFRR